jgi:hypothetical protein
MNETVVKLQINSIQDRRGVVNKLQEFDIANGVKKSQRAKHELPNWEFVSCILDSQYNKKWHTIDDIINILVGYNIRLSVGQVTAVMRILADTKAAIHTYRRACGASCHEVLTHMGELHCRYNEENKREYAFGITQDGVRYYRRAFNLHLDPA